MEKLAELKNIVEEMAAKGQEIEHSFCTMAFCCRVFFIVLFAKFQTNISSQ